MRFAGIIRMRDRKGKLAEVWPLAKPEEEMKKERREDYKSEWTAGVAAYLSSYKLCI